jgi:SAM-dependent methyltransferase
MFSKLRDKLLDPHYGRPYGFIGQYVGKQMARDHLPENSWTVGLLDIQPTDWVLEIGFGAGVAVEMVNEKLGKGGKIAGIDFSKTMVRTATKRNTLASKQGRVDLRFGDAIALPYSPRTFHKVYSIHSIYFWREPQIALKEIYRVLKPNGMVVLTILPKERWNENNPDMTVGTPTCIPYSGSELCHRLRAVGFTTTHIEDNRHPEHRSNYSVIALK